MVRLLDAMLDLTRLRSGAALPLRRGTADLVAIGRQVLDEQRLGDGPNRLEQAEGGCGEGVRWGLFSSLRPERIF